MRKLLVILLFLISQQVSSQELNSLLTLEEYLGYVKKFHPVVKQANLVIDESEAKLLKSRGAFDPKLEVDYDRKQFKGSEYFDKLNATFKIPTWYGIELKANFEENSGIFLNPELTVPDDGLYSVGVSVSLARGLLMNERMSMLKQAKFFTEQARADRQILVNNIMFEATKAYFKWLKQYNEQLVFKDFLDNAEFRLNGIKRRFRQGDLAAIDTLETGIIVNTRKLSLEQANIKYLKSQLELSNFLWLDNNIPIELREDIVPDNNTINNIDGVLALNSFQLDTLDINAHPKMISLDRKFEGLKVEKRLKANKLLPQVDLEYNFLTETPRLLNSFDETQYKGGVKVNFPLFLRKERGDLRVAKLKLQETEFEIASTRVNLSNKINALSQEILSLNRQTGYAEQIVNDYQTLLRAEERKFAVGESSVFLVNSRESKLIDSKLKAIKVINDFLHSKASLFNALALDQ
jgi:outer membrane protein TolC